MKWILYFIPVLAVELLCLLTNPIVCLFVEKRLHEDKVKRLGGVHLMEREFLWPIFSYWQTHDNAADEYWWGRYNEDSIFRFVREMSQDEYNNNWFLRYFLRVLWLTRNIAYGFHYNWFSVPVEPETVKERGAKGKGFWYRLHSRKSSWQLQYQIPLGNRYIDGNIGWKQHKEFPKMMYANRVIGLRSYK